MRRRRFGSRHAIGALFAALLTAAILVLGLSVGAPQSSGAQVPLAALADCESQSGWSDSNQECEPTATDIPSEASTETPAPNLELPTNTPEPMPTDIAAPAAAETPTEAPTESRTPADTPSDTPAPANTPTQTPVVPADVHFSDDFESGSFAQWTDEPVGIVMQSSDAFSGAWAANATSTGNRTYVRTALESAQSEIYLRLRFKILSQGSGNAVNLARLRTTSDRSILGVMVFGNGRVGFIDDTAGRASFGAFGANDPVVTKGVWHEIQVHVRIGADSLVEVWYDGNQVSSLTRTAINLGTRPIGRLQLGENASAGKSYSILFDDVAADSAFIPYTGPVDNVPPTETPAPTAAPADTTAATAPPTNTPTETAIPLATSTPEATATGTSTAIPMPPTNTPQPTPTNSATANPTATRSPAPASTPTAVPAPTATRTPGSGGTAVLLAAGDISTCSNDNDETTAELLDGLSGTVAVLGDIVYESGTPSEYANCYDPTWGRHKGRTRPAVGNHEYLTSGASGYFGYFGSAAGDPSTGYYSYDLGSWHIVVLNSNCSEVGGCGAGSAQERWLRADLAAHPNSCTLAYWHHPRFSSGSNHGSSTAMRPIWQALWDYNAEIVLSSHEHNYERFAPQDAAGNADPERGIREFVVGTGGKGHYPFGPPIANSEVRNSDTFGILELTLGPSGYSWRFVPEPGKTFTDSGSGSCQ